MSQIRHTDPHYWYSNNKEQRLSAYCNAPITSKKKSMTLLKRTVWNF